MQLATLQSTVKPSEGECLCKAAPEPACLNHIQQDASMLHDCSQQTRASLDTSTKHMQHQCAFEHKFCCGGTTGVHAMNSRDAAAESAGKCVGSS